MQTEVNGVELAYEVEGRGRPVVLVHGLGSTLNTWEGVVQSLTNSYEVYRFDLRGSGRSDVPDGPYSLETWVADLHAFFDDQDLDAVHLVGHSLGSLISMQFAAQHPDRVRTLSLAAAGPGMPEEKQSELQTVVNEIKRNGMTAHAETETQESLSEHTKQTRPELVGLYREMILENDPKGYTESMLGLMEANLMPVVDDIVAPTLLLAAENDTVTPPVASFILSNKIPSAEVTVIQDAGHMAQLEAPKAVSTELHRFIANN
ncbi:alpha/beta fold hydrolase [Haloarchaeobius sp. TZWSO28]|uniref:alpha/beta fold hydrolase n=1 Tax=Haloarchaeobius sp. TZWSO28 TaxID=3446119 RepID=UPI003EBCB83E